jgi:hypothetical protein
MSLVLLYTLATVLMQLRLKDLREQMTIQIVEQQTVLVDIAETTARNGADTVTESIIKDCRVMERTEFDDLLGRLDKGLSRAELTKLKSLFGSCGDFYAQRKTLMVSRLAREVEVYGHYVEQLQTLTDKQVRQTYQVDSWNTLVGQEEKLSELFSALVLQQENIIDTLLSGKLADSEAMKTILQEAQETQELLLLANRQTADTRTGLIPL